MAIFLRQAGFRINVTDESVGQWLIAIAEARDRDRDAKTEEFAAWLERATRRMP